MTNVFMMFMILIGGILIGACISYCIAANRFMDETHKITEKYSKMFGDLISHCNQYLEGNSDRMLNILDVIKNLCDTEDQFTEDVSKIIAELQKNEKSRSEMQNEAQRALRRFFSINDERWELIQNYILENPTREKMEQAARWFIETATIEIMKQEGVFNEQEMGEEDGARESEDAWDQEPEQAEIFSGEADRELVQCELEENRGGSTPEAAEEV